MLLSGCGAVRDDPDVWQWKRMRIDSGFRAANRSQAIRAHSRRAARNLATSSRKSLCEMK